MKITELNFDKCLYDPVKKDYKELKKYSEFKELKGLDVDKIITYLILLYDPDSPLRREVPDWITRRKEAMIMAGYPVQKSGRFSDSVELVLENKNPASLLMLMKLLRIFGSPDYTALIMYYHLFNATLQAQAMGTFDKPSVLIKAISDTLEKIKEQEDIVFGGQETIELKKALYKDIADDESNVKVEHVADLISKGDNLDDFNPYGKYDVTDEGKAFGFVADE